MIKICCVYIWNSQVIKIFYIYFNEGIRSKLVTEQVTKFQSLNITSFCDHTSLNLRLTRPAKRKNKKKKKIGA